MIGFSARGTASLRRFCSCIVPNYLDRQGLAMLASERREDQTESLSFRANERGGQQRFAGRIMKSPREVLIRPIALSVAAILLTSLVVAEAYSHAKALHVRDPEDLALALSVADDLHCSIFWQHESASEGSCDRITLPSWDSSCCWR